MRFFEKFFRAKNRFVRKIQFAVSFCEVFFAKKNFRVKKRLVRKINFAVSFCEDFMEISDFGVYITCDGV